MKTVLIIVIVFITLGVASLIMSLVHNASWSIVVFQLGYLILACSFGYIAWKKHQNAQCLTKPRQSNMTINV